MRILAALSSSVCVFKCMSVYSSAYINMVFISYLLYSISNLFIICKSVYSDMYSSYIYIISIWSSFIRRGEEEKNIVSPYSYSMYLLLLSSIYMYFHYIIHLLLLYYHGHGELFLLFKHYFIAIYYFLSFYILLYSFSKRKTTKRKHVFSSISW